MRNAIMRRSCLPVVLALAVVALAGCGKKSPTSPSVTMIHSCAGGTLSGTFGATIDGTAFVPTCLDALSVNGGLVSFGATNVTQNNLASFIDIAIAVQASAPGTFQLSNKSISNAAVSVGGSHLWISGAASTGTGTVTITTLTATRIAGTFTFDMAAGPNATGTKTVRNGTFDLSF
jgi:hypothetical protein